MAQDSQPLIWIDLEMSGLSPERDRIIEVAVVVTDPEPRGRGRRAGAGRASERCGARRHGHLEQIHARAHPASSIACGRPRIGEAEVEARDARIPRAACADRGIADVRKLDLPGSPFPRALHARAGGLLPLSQPRRQHVEGARPPLEARHRRPASPSSGKHEALADIYESIEELRYYRAHLLQL